MYLGIRCLTKGYLLEWMPKGGYEYENEAILKQSELLARIKEVLNEHADDE
jgi:hypothetical protein